MHCINSQFAIILRDLLSLRECLAGICRPRVSLILCICSNTTIQEFGFRFG